ncbi:MAG: hypothetical protein JWM09_1425, partial [Francisellaceae bacterium]|nr:hypothetical protein [Francisellaceae bacterium]
GYSLFDLKGGSHFIALSTNRPLLIYSTVKSSKKKLPKWFLEGFNDSIKIVYRKRELFKKPIGIEWFAYSNFSIKVSTRERALMEVLASVPLGCSYSHAVLLFQGKETLQPKLIQELLESCLSYKVKRLFLHLAKKCDLKWLNYLNLERIDIGQGKRQIGEGGLYDPEQQISVPKLNVLDDPDMEVEV